MVVCYRVACPPVFKNPVIRLVAILLLAALPLHAGAIGTYSKPHPAKVATAEFTRDGEPNVQSSGVLVFDPTRVTTGIELSDDPVLRFRRRAYSESVARRTG